VRLVKSMIKRALGLFIVVLCLAGCETTIGQDGPMALKRQGSSLNIAVCKSVSVTSLSMSSRQPAQNQKWQPFWNGAGKGSITKGDILSTAATSSVFLEGETKVSPPVGPSTEYDVLLLGSHESDSLRATFSTGPQGLSESSWLHPDGTYTEEPCPATP